MPAPDPRPARYWLACAFDALTLLVGALALVSVLLGVSADSRLSSAAATSLPRAPEAPPANVAESERDGVLTVLVEGPTKAPLAGASVRLLWEQQRRFFDAGRGVSDRDGTVKLLRVPRGRVWLLAEGDGYARASTQLIVEGGERRVTLSLSLASTLTVTVTDEAARPLAGATVLVTTADPLPFGALTDEAGLAKLARLGQGPFTVKASAPGYESVSRSGVAVSATLALRRLGSITVRVNQADGTPAALADVQIGGVTLWPARSATAGADGTCRISGLLAGSYDLKASRGAQVSRVLVGLLLARGEDQEVTLTLEPGRMVTAQVTDGSGPNALLVAGADVVLAEEGLSSFPLRGRTGSDGKVTLGPISSGPSTLSGRAPDFVSSAVVAVPEATNQPVILPLLRGGTLHGEVADARGYPIDGASVEIIGQDSQGLPIAETPELMRFRRSHFGWALTGQTALLAAGELGVMPGPIPPIPGSNAALSAAALEGSAPPLDDEELLPWISDGSGRFHAKPVTPGRVRALVRHPDFVESISEPVSLEPGGAATVKVTLLRGGTLEGRVRDARDSPIENAEVEVVAERGSFQRATVTASDGSFAFSALPRDVIVNVRRAGSLTRVAKRISVRVEEGGRHQLDVTLPSPREAVTVTVLDDEGEPLELAEVNAVSLAPTEPLRTTAFSDARGQVTLEDALGLPLRVTAQAPGFARHTLTPTDAAPSIELRLTRGALVRGRVTTLRGRRGVEGALVTLTSQGLRKTATSNADGEWQLADVALGSVELHVSHPDFAEARASLVVTNPGRRDRAFELPSLDLEEAGAVEGEVRDERGEPVSGARVALGRAPSYLPAGALPRGVALTGADGSFSLRGLPPGESTIEALLPERGRGSARVEVQSNRTHTGLRITLRPADAAPETFSPGGVAITLGERGSGDALVVVVVAVAENSEAERAGLLAGDVLLAIDEAKPLGAADARARLGGRLQSDVVVSVSRGGSPQRFSVMREPVRR